MKGNIFIGISVSTLLGSLAACTSVSNNNSEIERPNVLFIMTDDLGWGDLSCYYSKDMRTPNIDKLASEGVKMNNFHASAPVSSPSRAAFMTGCFPDMVGVQGVIRYDNSHNYGYLKHDVKTLADQFKAGGYNTCLVGKWHLGLQSPNLPNDRGFDSFKGWLAGSVSNNMEHTLYNQNFMRENKNPVNTSGTHVTDVFTDWAIDYIKESKDDKNPFFLFLSYTAPHDPIQPTEESLKRVLEREKGIDIERAKYVALIEHVDGSVGKVVKALEENGKLDNTIIMFISDNGGEVKYKANNGPYRGGKHTMWEGGLKVPFIAWKPGTIQKGVELDNMVVTMDLFPTLLDLTGLHEYIPENIDGKSFSDLLLGKPYKDPERVLTFVEREGWKHMGQAYYAMRFDEWKVFHNDVGENFMYVNIEEDELEKSPKMEEEVPYEIVRKFQDLMEKHMTKVGRVPWQTPSE